MQDDFFDDEVTEIISKTLNLKSEKYYVFFNEETGDIISISNNENELRSSKILVDVSEIGEILKCSKTFSDYKIFYDIKNKKHLLKDLEMIKSKEIQWNYNGFKIPKKNEKNVDIKISQCKKEKKWIVLLDEGVINFLQNNYGTYPMEFYITEENDINILIDTLRIDLLKYNDKKQILIASDSSAERFLKIIITRL